METPAALIQFDQISWEVATVGISADRNRAIGENSQIDATDDISAAKTWLDRVAHKKNTHSSYRKECERFILWASIERRKRLSSIAHEDVLAYKAFLLNPQPASKWISRNEVRLSRSHPDWRPFSGPLSPSSQRQACIILNSLFSWLVSARYLKGNPFSLSKNTVKVFSTKPTRFLDPSQMEIVKNSIDSYEKSTSSSLLRYRRSKWLVTLLFLTGMRSSEVIATKMGDFYVRQDRSGEKKWWLQVTGKGDKTRSIPVTAEMLNELEEYRATLGLSRIPQQGEETPLLAALTGEGSALTRSALHLVIKGIFHEAANFARASQGEGSVDAKILENASAHWLRHTAGSNMANSNISIASVRDTLGHESIATTSGYLHTDDDKRHKDTEESHKIEWT